MKEKIFNFLWIPLFKKWQIFDSPYWMFTIYRYYKQIKWYWVLYIIINDESKQPPSVISEIELKECILFNKLN